MPHRPLGGIMGEKAQILLWAHKNGCMYYATSLITECWHGHMGRMRNIDLGSMMNKYGIGREDLSEFMLSSPDISGVNEPPHVPMTALSD